MAMEDILARRFAPLNFLAIVGYPHHVPQIDEWKDLLPIFYEGGNDNPVEHALEVKSWKGCFLCFPRIQASHCFNFIRMKGIPETPLFLIIQIL